MTARKLASIHLVAVTCGIITINCTPTTTLPPNSPNIPTVTLEKIAANFTSPVALASVPDGSGRKLVADQIGEIHVLNGTGINTETPFLSLRDRMVTVIPPFDERGLLGLVLHPDFSNNGRLFVYYSTPLSNDDPTGFNHKSRVAEFLVSTDNPDHADPDSERVILDILQPQSNHNAGQLAFGPDGMLYIGTGDGGSGGDRGFGHNPDIGNSQDTTTLLGKILRIDIDRDEPYAIPADNPFVNDLNARDEIHALGLRNPWRFSFDRDTGQLYVGDVGQNAIEEVSIVSAGDNLGWNIREGNACFNPANNCPITDEKGQNLVAPIITYPHNAATEPTGSSVIGGYIYRGHTISALTGRYIFADFNAGVGGRLYIATRDTTSQQWTVEDLPITNKPNGRPDFTILSLGEDAAGELYVLAGTGDVYRIVNPNVASPLVGDE